MSDLGTIISLALLTVFGVFMLGVMVTKFNWTKTRWDHEPTREDLIRWHPIESLHGLATHMVMAAEHVYRREPSDSAAQLLSKVRQALNAVEIYEEVRRGKKKGGAVRASH